jgi:flagellar protein FliS
MASSLLQFYGAAKGLLLDSVRNVDLEKIAQLRADMREIASAFRAARAA